MLLMGAKLEGIVCFSSTCLCRKQILRVNGLWMSGPCVKRGFERGSHDLEAYFPLYV